MGFTVDGAAGGASIRSKDNATSRRRWGEIFGFLRWFYFRSQAPGDMYLE